MSNRVLKKLYGDKDLSSALGIDGMSESDDGGASFRGATEKPHNNRFELLNSVEHSLSDTEAKEDDDRENDLPQDGQERKKLEKQDSTHSTDSLKRKKKKKKKKLKSQKSTEENLDDGEDEIEASVRDISRVLGEPLPSSSEGAVPKQHPVKLTQKKSVLTIELKYLNPDNEMRKIFGSKVIQSEQASKRRQRGKPHGRSTVLVMPRNWPRLQKSVFSMKLLNESNDIYHFKFEHSRFYQGVQIEFYEAVESFNPDNIVAFLNRNPFHIDALIQFSDICRMGDDTQMAAEMIERALFYMESVLHPLFIVPSGNNRLDYRMLENRSFYICLLKHAIYTGLRGCNRTALEFCKFILSLDPEGDPMGILLMIDNYAIRSSQYAYLIKLYQEWNMERNLYQLPNFAFSIALATYLLAIEEEESNTTADLLLQDALIMFPGFLFSLLEKCGVEPDKKVLVTPYFQRINDPKSLTTLITLYVCRTHSIWKAKNIIHWLEQQVHEVIKRYENKDPLFVECEAKLKVRYPVLPRNILRHIILSDIKDANISLPQDMMSTPIFGYDPLPPTDSITPYEKRPKPEACDDRGMLNIFLHSLLPSFSMPHESNNALPQDGAARGAEAAGHYDLRRSVTSLIDAMRDLISTAQNAADMPNEADVDSDDDTREA